MAEIYKFFNAIETSPGVYDREYLASDFAEYFGSVLSTGLLHTDEVPGLSASVEEGTLNTIVAPGKAVMKGYFYENTTPLTLAHDLPEASLDRIDRVVLRLDLRNAERSITANVKTGVAAAVPVAPELQRDNFIHEISLAQILVRANTVQLLQTDLIDERLDEELAGLVYSLISIPTDQLQTFITARMAELDLEADAFEAQLAQNLVDYEQEFQTWFDGLQQTGFATPQYVDNAVDDLAGAGRTTETVKSVADALIAHKQDYAKHPGVATTTNVGNAYAVTLDPTPASYVNGMGLVATVNTDSTGNATLNVNGLGAVPIKKANGTNVSNLKANGVYTLRYSNSSFILQGEGASGDAIASDLLSGKTATTDAGEITGTLLLDGNASTSQVLSGSTFYSNNAKSRLTGSMPNRGTFNLGFGASVLAGYYSGGTVPSGALFKSGIVTVQQGNPTYNGFFEVTDIPFTPTYVILNYSYSGSIVRAFLFPRMSNAGGAISYLQATINNTGYESVLDTDNSTGYRITSNGFYIAFNNYVVGTIASYIAYK